MAIPEAELGKLSDAEFEAITRVLHRDRILRTTEENRLHQAKVELQSLRKRGALRQGCDASRSCARCTIELGRLINRGAPCSICRKKVCKACRQYGDLEKYWVCVVCQKQMELKAISGEWMQEFCRRPSKRRLRRVPAGDALRKAIHESRRKGILNAQPTRIPSKEVKKIEKAVEEPKEEVPNKNAHTTAIPQFLDIRRHLKKPESPLVQEIRKQLKKLELPPPQHATLKRSESQPVLDESEPSHGRPSPLFPRAPELSLVREIKKRFKHSDAPSVEVEPEPSPLLESRKFSRSVDTLATISKKYQLVEEMEKKTVARKLSRLDNSSSSGCPSPEGCRTPTPHDDCILYSSKRNSSPLTRQRAFGDNDSAYSTSPRALHLKHAAERLCSGSVSSVSESEIEKTTGVVFRKVTLKKHRFGEEKRERALSETIPEVEEESPSSKPVTSMSLSSGNIPSEVCSSSASRSSTLPLSVRSKLYMQPPSAARSRPFASSFFSTSGVLRKLTALRDESSLSHRSLSHGRLRPRGRSLSGGSDDSKHDGATTVPQISVSDCADTARVNSGTSSDKDSVGVQEDDVDPVFTQHSRSQISLSSFVGRSESMVSIYSDAGGGRYGTVVVSGEVLFGLGYNYKASCMEVHVKECRNIAAVKPIGSRRNRSDPYVKVYLLPDRTKSGKRKTKVKKHTLNPNFDEILKFQVTISELETRTLWLSVWHSDIFGRNDFLGEVMLPLGHEVFENPGLRWYPLQERMESLDSHISYKGDLILALKYVPPDVTMHKPTKRSGGPAKGSLHVLVKEARNLMAVRSNGTSDPFCKSYLLPDKSKSGKQKTQVMKKTCSPKWNHTFVYDDVSVEELHDRCLELTIWDYDKITSNDFLGGVRLNLGTGKYEGRDVEWMDSQGEEASVWHSMLDKPNMWIDCSLLLRSSMQSRRL